jgi:hypothetical protein
MARTQMTVEQIRAEVSRRIRAVVDDKAVVDVPLPTWHEPDDAGCNWRMAYFGGDAAAYIGAIHDVVSKARAEVLLIADERAGA